MAEQMKSRIGFVSGGAGSMPHYNSFLPIVPKEIELDFQGLELYGKSLYEIAGKKETIVQRVSDFVVSRNWHGVIVTAAPTEVLNPARRARGGSHRAFHHRASRLRDRSRCLLGTNRIVAHAV